MNDYDIIYNYYLSNVDKKLPFEGFGKFEWGSRRADKNTLLSWALPSHPAHANVNCMSKLHIAITF